MVAFKLTLPDGTLLTGENYFPEAATLVGTSSCPRPLIVAVHGGAYSSSYFDADSNHSVRQVAQHVGIPTIAINRPGYEGTTPLPETAVSSSFIQEQGRYLHEKILPFLWKEHALTLGVSSIFLYAHSIGGAVAIIAAALHQASPRATRYPLCGISISGVGSIPERLPIPEFTQDAQERKGVIIRFPSAQKDALMLGPPKGYDPAVLEQTERLQHDISLEEIYDINILWQDYRQKYTDRVEVCVLYTMGEYDNLWGNTDEDVKGFAAEFTNAPTVEARRLLSAPHCIELSLQGTGLMLRTFGFAIESAVHLDINSQL